MDRVKTDKRPAKRPKVVRVVVPPLSDAEVLAIRAVLGVIGNAPGGSMFYGEDGVLNAFGPATEPSKVAEAPSVNGGMPQFTPI